MFLKCAQIIAGALIGCSAGFLNSVKIKGTHTAMKSGMLLAETLMRSYSDGFKADYESADYESAVHSSWIGDELWVVRNSEPEPDLDNGKDVSLVCDDTKITFSIDGNKLITKMKMLSSFSFFLSILFSSMLKVIFVSSLTKGTCFPLSR